MDMHGQSTAVMMIRQIIETLKRLGIEHTDQIVEAGIIVRNNAEQCDLALAKGFEIHLVILGDRGDLV